MEWLQERASLDGNYSGHLDLMRQEFWTHKIKVARSLGLAIAALTLSCQATPVSVDYDLRVPEGTPPVESWPVIVAVHGLRGNGPDTCDTWADIAARAGYLLACPSFNDEARYWEFDHGEVEAIDQMLTEVAATHPLDLPIYLTGISAGGRFTHRYTFNYPERVRAAAVVADASNQDYEPAALEVPLFWAMGAKDTDWVPRLQPLVEDLEAAGFQVESYVDPEAGHAWSDPILERAIAIFNRTP
jgi:poly(3-hydroxybutyrate) depolymerase